MGNDEGTPGVESFSPAMLDAALALYDGHRYLDAYEATRALWARADLAGSLDARTLVHAARLAGRLGGFRVRRWLLRAAAKKAPGDPLVRYFHGDEERRGRHLLDQLREFERRPEPGFDDPRWDASWLADRARLLAMARDFPGAHRLVERARAHGTERGWVESCASYVLLAEDRWDDALSAAERAAADSPAAPYVAHALCECLSRHGRVAEAAERVLAVAESGQSWETLSLGQYYLCAVAERAGSEAERTRVARRALALADLLPSRMPLADAAARHYLGQRALDAAQLLGDRARCRAEMARHPGAYAAEVAHNLDAAPDAPTVRLPFRPVFQKRNTCYPASVAAAAACFGVEIAEDALAEQLTYDGTADWRVVDWLGEHGFAARPFIADPETVRALVRGGVPVMLMFDSLESSHATVVVGLDEAEGTLLLHDPSLDRQSRLLCRHLGEGQAPLGPEAVAFVPVAQAAALDVIPAAAARRYGALVDFRRALARSGLREAEGVVAALEHDLPRDPQSRRLRALHGLIAGRLAEAIDAEQALLAELPSSVYLRRELLDALERTRDTARIRATLEDIVLRGRIPGARQDEDWLLPPVGYVVRYADYLGVSSPGFAEAERLLWWAILRAPGHGPTFHVLGDVLARQGRHDESLLPYRLGAQLAEEHGGFARGYADALRRAGREAEALDFLEARAARQEDRAQAGMAAITWLDALEDWGHADRAIDEMQRAFAARQGDPEFGAFAAQFWVRMGRWDRAEEALAAVEKSGNRARHMEAATQFLEAAGRWREAIVTCEGWLAEQPENPWARRSMLRLCACERGRAAAVALSREWMEARPGNEAFEDLHLDQLLEQQRGVEYRALLRRRVARDPHNAPAWRSLAHHLLDEAEGLAPLHAAPLVVEADAILAKVEALTGIDAGALAVRARLCRVRGDLPSAEESLLAALELEPGYGFAASQLWELAGRGTVAHQKRTQEDLERALLRTPGHKHGARELADRIAQRFDAAAAEQAVERWRAAVPDDPELVEALAEVWLSHGQGRTDAARAAQLLEGAVSRYPNHFDLWSQLARAYQVLGREDEAIVTQREQLRRRPLAAGARSGLATALCARGQADEAVALMAEGTALDPASASGWIRRAAVLQQLGRRDEAIAVLEEALARDPRGIDVRRILIEQLQEAERHDDAVRVARAGVAEFEDGAYLWFLLADTLGRGTSRATVDEIEAAYRTALRWNNGLFQAADHLAQLLADQGRHAEALTLLDDQIDRLADPTPARGRRAWVQRHAGQKDEARKAMGEVLVRDPAYAWGWDLFMGWLEEDKAWDEARSLLREAPPIVRAHPALAAHRLALLRAAGVAAEDLDGEWDRLLADFPDSTTIHLRRIDELLSRKRVDRAAELLAHVEERHPRSPWVTERRVEVQAARGEWPGAVSTALALWSEPGDEDVWPEEGAWQALTDETARASAAEGALALVEQHGRIRRRAFQLLVDHLGGEPPSREFFHRLLRRLDPRRWLGTHPRIRPLLAALDALARHDREDGYLSAAVIEKLARLDERGVVLRWWRRNLERARRLTPLWQKVGFVLAEGGVRDRAALRRWLADWRERAGVEMWAVANYASALRRVPGSARLGPLAPLLSGVRLGGLPEDLAEIERTTSDALVRLPHDSTARYFALVRAEAILRRGGDFVAAVRQHEDLIHRADPEQWIPPSIHTLPTVIPIFYRLAALPEGRLDAAQTAEVVGNTLTLARLRRARPPWVRKEWLRLLRGRLPWWRQLQIRAMLLGDS